MTPLSHIFLAILGWFLIGAMVIGLLIGTGIVAWRSTRKAKPSPYRVIDCDDSELHDFLIPRVPRVRA